MGDTQTQQIQHINYAIPAKKHTSMYLMHKFWARKPHNIVAEYIYTYSKEGDIVLDPFGGSGVSGIEALHLGRKAIVTDLDPIATFITRCTCIPINLEKLQEQFTILENKVKNKIIDLYKTKCIRCNSFTVSSHVVYVSDEKNPHNEKPVEIWYKCKCSQKSLKKKVTNDDIKIIKEIENNFSIIVKWYPKDKFQYSDSKAFMKKEKWKSVDELFTKRNLIALSWIYDAIEEIEDTNLRDLMKFTFTSGIVQASRMIPYSSGLTTGGPSWKIHSYWVPPEHFEINAWSSFEERFKKTIRGKQESNAWNEGKKFYVITKTKNGNMNFKQIDEVEDSEKIIQKIQPLLFKEAKNIDDLLLKDKTVLIKTHSALELINESVPQNSFLKPNTVDYVFTDPPYGGSVQYFELSYLWLSWLKGKNNDERFRLDFDNEITINEKQNKGFEKYDLMLNKAFRQIFRALKSGKFLTVTFHNTDIRIRNSLIRNVVYSGFDLDKIVYQAPAHISAKASLQLHGSAIGDYYIRFVKTVSEKEKTLEEIDKETQERIIVESVKKILAERGEPTSYAWIINTIDTELVKRGYSLISNPEDIQKILEKRSDIFKIVEVSEGLKGVKVKKWWFKDPKTVAHLERIPLNERLEKAVIDVLRREVTVTFDDILRKIFIEFPNSLTPETQSVKSILDEYAEPIAGGKWQLGEAFKAELSMHNTMEKYLAYIGKKLGFKIWVADKNKIPEVSKFVEEDLNLDIPKEKLDRVKKIDAIWIKNNRISFVFEVENTTGITEAIIRSSNIPYDVKRFIVIPKKRLNFLIKKLTEPMIKERLERERWNVISYDDLESLYRNKKISQKDLEKISLKKIKTESQKNLKSFK